MLLGRATTTLPSSPDRHHLRHWVIDTRTWSDHCRFRGKGRHAAPQRGSTRLSLFLQIAPSGLTQDLLPRRHTARFRVGHTSSPDQARNLCTRSRCVRIPTSRSASSVSLTRDVLHIRLALRHSVAPGNWSSWLWDRHLVTRLFLTDLQSALLLRPLILLCRRQKGLTHFLGLCWRTWLKLLKQLPPCLEPETSRNSLDHLQRFASASQNKHTVRLCVITVLSVMIGSSTLVSTCCSIQAVVRLNFPK